MGFTKKYIGGNGLKSLGPGQLADLESGARWKRVGGVFNGGRYPNVHYRVVLRLQDYKKIYATLAIKYKRLIGFEKTLRFDWVTLYLTNFFSSLILPCWWQVFDQTRKFVHRKNS